jgi:dienelactone hydrolase
MTSPTVLPFDYTHDGIDFAGVIVSADEANAPTVLVFHGMEGRSDAQLEFCHRLAALGYRAVAVDLFGRAATLAGADACGAAMTQLIADRDTMRGRLIGVVDILSNLAGVRRDAMAAIGFCFGGPCMLDLARHGTHLVAVASFHGWDDPFAPPHEMLALATELTERGADWQLHAYGHALHAFMAPFANAPERGIQYDAVVARRAWASLEDFLTETFGVVLT